MQITVRVDDEKVKVGIRNVGRALPEVTKADVRVAMEGAKVEASGDYPGGGYMGYTVPTVYGQTYQRTGEYGRSFDVTETGLSYTLSSDAWSPRGEQYTVAVGGNAAGQGQSRWHVKRWPVIADVIKKWVATLMFNLDKSLSKLLRDEGMGL